MLGPNEIKELNNEMYNIADLVEKIDQSIKNHHGMYVYEKAILIDIVLPFPVRNQIAQMYLDAGWKYVYHQTSYETKNKEEFHSTSFLFSMDEIDRFCYPKDIGEFCNVEDFFLVTNTEQDVEFYTVLRNWNEVIKF